MRIVIGLICVALLIGWRTTPAAAQSAQSGVAALLSGSAKAWNHGDLDTFMQSYEDSPATVYVGAKTVIHGYANIRAHYAAHYQPGQMGTLRVSDLAVRPLGADYAVATARWHLARTSGELSGLFSLVLHRNAAGWHIITDHTP
jgi:ketosteroid isomerase-like protein